MIQRELDSDQLEQLHSGLHGDPFSILGMHPVENPKTGKVAGLVVRTFQPYALDVELVPEKGKAKKMERITKNGVFEVFLPRRVNAYIAKFRLTMPNGDTQEIYDPYCFGSQIADEDLYFWGEGTHQKAYSFMGAHPKTIDGVDGVHFVVSAPAARRVSVVGDFNHWDGRVYPMRKHHEQGLWELFIPGIKEFDKYKYEIKAQGDGYPFLKSDPFATFAEVRPATASIVYDVAGYEWSDSDWMKERSTKNYHDDAVSVYELHLGSWKRDPSDPDRLLSYQEIADQLVPYVSELGFTHVELLPIAEHPYDPSWGYQQTGYYATTSRFGTPKDFMYLVDKLHQAGIGVIVDWVPGHFAKDAFGLIQFDGTALYEHQDDRQGEHKDWGTKIFNYGRTEVRSFLISNALYWLEKFHIDGLRVDAVASMLYLDYSREAGEWVPNKYGGRENIEAIQLLRDVNSIVHTVYPGVITFAEESTAWGGVTKSPKEDGLGFDFKWNMGWMNDTLEYVEKDPIYRAYHHDQLTFSLVYAFSENFILPFSHDEVVHMKGSMIKKMPGDDWQKFANLRLLYTYMYAHPGKKLLFMGDEFGQWDEWSEARSLDWHLAEFDRHNGVQKTVTALNKLYKEEGALHKADHSWQGFSWIDLHDRDNSVLSFYRIDANTGDKIICVFNFTPTVHHNYKVGVPEEGEYVEIFNSDSEALYGSNVTNNAVKSVPTPWQGQDHFVELSIPPLAGILLKRRS